MEQSSGKSGSPFVIVSSPGMHGMGESIQRILLESGVSFPHHRLEYTRFANGEYLPRIPETVRQQHVFFLHPLQDPDPNTGLMMMLLSNDALKRSSIAGMTLVIPYIPYLRQDRKDRPRVPISARLVADLIESNRMVQKIITIDMHAEQEQGFFSIPVDNLSSMTLFAHYFRERFTGGDRRIVVVAPDFGAAVRARRFAKKIGEDISVSIVEKRRSGPNVAEVVSIIGPSVDGAIVIMYDDMIDTGGTIRNAAIAMKHLGAAEVFLAATHPIFSGTAVKEFSALGIPVACTDSIPRDPSFVSEHDWFTSVPIDRLLADAILESTMIGGSVSKLNA